MSAYQGRKLWSIPIPVWMNIRWCAIAIQCICLLALAPLFYTALFNHPAGADDYRYSQWQGFLHTLSEHYNWSGGRYFGALLVMLNPLHWNSIVGYRVACLLLLLLFLFSFYRLLLLAGRKYLSIPGPAAGAIAAVTVLLMINNIDGLSETFFWYTGAATHTAPLILFSWLLILFVSINESPTRLQLIMASLLCIAIMGGGELTMLLCGLICWAGWLYNRRQHQSGLQRFFGILVLICVVCGLFSILAPGNFLRQDRLYRNWFMVLPNWLYFTQKFAYKWLFDPFLLSYSLIVLVITQYYPLRKPYLSIFGSFLLPFIAMYLLSFPGHLTLGTLFYPRIMNVIYIFFLLAWLVFVVHLSYALRPIFWKGTSNDAPLRQLLLVVATIGLLISFNTHDLRAYNLFTIYKGLAKGVPQQYSRELEHRYQLLHQGGDTVLVPRLTTKQNNVLYFLDIGNNATNKQNEHYAQYWGKKAVALLPDTATIK